ncbi:MAG: hypothetical protein ABIX37_00675 [Gammaproteobacteria bacterium]
MKHRSGWLYQEQPRSTFSAPVAFLSDEHVPVAGAVLGHHVEVPLAGQVAAEIARTARGWTGGRLRRQRPSQEQGGNST